MKINYILHDNLFQYCSCGVYRDTVVKVADGNCLCMPIHPDCPICLGEQKKIDKCITSDGSDMRKCLPPKPIKIERLVLSKIFHIP